MPWSLILSLLMSALSFFTAKKSGASTAAALTAGAIGGLGTYYVATQTDWGKSVISDLEDGWISLKDNTGTILTNDDGSPVVGPEGSEVVYNPDGTVARDTSGNVITKLITTTGETLQSWGGAGTAAVIGATALATNEGLLNKVLPFLIIGGAVVLLS